jgi:hypothetical protein
MTMNFRSFDCVEISIKYHLEYMAWNLEIFLVYREYVVSWFALYHSL